MKKINYQKLIYRNKGIISIITVSVLAIALVVNVFVRDLDYSANTQLLVIQQQESSIDSVSASKSAERIAESLSKVIYTSDFRDKVLATSIVSDTLLESTDPGDQKKEWEKKVAAQALAESGLVRITTYDADPAMAKSLADAVSFVLLRNGADYHGGGDSILIRKVDEAIVSNFPVRPNIVLTVFSSLILGFIVSLSYLVAFKELRIQDKLLKVVEEEKEEKREALEKFNEELENLPDSYAVLQPETWEDDIQPQPQENYNYKTSVQTMFDHMK